MANADDRIAGGVQGADVREGCSLEDDARGAVSLHASSSPHCGEDRAGASRLSEPPEPPALTRDFHDLARDAARIRALQRDQERRARRTRLAALGIVVAGIALIAVGAVAALVAAHVPAGIGASEETAVSGGTFDDASDDSPRGTVSSPSAASPQGEETVSAVEAVVAADQISASFSSLAANEDGLFDAFVQMFMDDYDRGVNGEASYALADLGIEAEELSSALLEGFSCSVENVDVHGQTAWVTLGVTSKSLVDQADAFARIVESSEVPTDGEEEYKAFLKGAYFDAFYEVAPRSHSLLVTVERTQGGWSVTEDVMEYVLGSVWYTSA